MKFEWTNTLEPEYEGCVKGYECLVSTELYISLEVINEYTDDWKHKQWYWNISIGDCTYEKGVCKTSKQAKKEAEKAWKNILSDMRKLVEDN